MISFLAEPSVAHFFYIISGDLFHARAASLTKVAFTKLEKPVSIRVLLVIDLVFLFE